jgi:3-oxoacyl-[acyl-carrier protein] reductase
VSRAPLAAGEPRLAGRVVALTGAGSGLGLQTTEVLLDQGAQVIANYRSSPDRLLELAERHPGMLHPLRGDIALESTAADIAERARGLGRLDVLVHNAGVSRDMPLITMSADDWDDVMRVNLRGAFLATKHSLRVMIKKRYGRCIYVSSLTAIVGNAGQANYAASKGGLHGLSNAVAQEYASRGVRSVVVAPGLLDTGIADKLPDPVRAAKADRQLLGAGPSSSVASTIAFLAGGEADFINAAVVRADGGMKW